MTVPQVYIASAGIVSPLGYGLEATFNALKENRSCIVPLRVFPLLQDKVLPVGQVSGLDDDPELPRTHRLARAAARMTMEGCSKPPDAVILGSTTGGILTTEQLLRDKVSDPKRFRYHGLQTLADDIVELVGCRGLGIMVSTACSSGAVAIALALRLIRAGDMESVLVGGVDSLSRLTYFGFHSLQLVDRDGAHPLDEKRQGISVAEAGAMLLLTSKRPEPPAAPLALILGAGLSCDAYHPTAPHPEGLGAQAAMEQALLDAGLQPSDLDYINLHGTGTPDNDMAETRAIHKLFPNPPAISSIKGATGHSLAASGALEAVCATLAVSRGLIPGNTGCRQPDPTLPLTPQLISQGKSIRTVLSNSLGFGGNNGSLVIGRVDFAAKPRPAWDKKPLAVHGKACLTGAGDLAATLAVLRAGKSAAGLADTERIPDNIPTRLVRRVKRLARLGLFLASGAHLDCADQPLPSSIFIGTAWGALSETWNFLEGLERSNEQFPSPIDFVGSVHNGAAGQIAQHFKATGANVTTSGGDYSFEQALVTAEALLEPGQNAILGAVDEFHSNLSPLLEPAIFPDTVPADGGGMLYVNHNPVGACCLIRMAFFRRASEDDTFADLAGIINNATEECRPREPVAAIFAGVPPDQVETGEEQLKSLLLQLSPEIPVFHYRSLLGEFASSSAVAALLAVHCIESGIIPGRLVNGEDLSVSDARILVLGTGKYITAMEFSRP